MIGEDAADQYPAAHVLSGDADHFEADRAVVDQDRVAERDVVGETLVRAAEPGGSADDTLLGGDHGLCTGLEAHLAALDLPHPDLRPLQVEQQAHRPPRHLRSAADGADGPQVIVVRAVREIEPRHVHARLDQPAEGWLFAGRRPHRADDLGLAHAPTSLGRSDQSRK